MLDITSYILCAAYSTLIGFCIGVTISCQNRGKANMNTPEKSQAESTANTSFASELTDLLNKHSKGTSSDIPDHILARYLIGCLSVLDLTKRQIEADSKRQRDSRTPKQKLMEGSSAYPSIEEVNAANQVQLRAWYKSLYYPGEEAIHLPRDQFSVILFEEHKIRALILERLIQEFGGLTPEYSSLSNKVSNEP